MGNSVVRQTVFHGSWWTKNCCRDGGDIVQVETIAEPLEERREHGAVGKKNSSGGDDGRETLVVDGGLDDAVVPVAGWTVVLERWTGTAISGRRGGRNILVDG